MSSAKRYSETVYNSVISETGHAMERLFVEILTEKLGVELIDRQDVNSYSDDKFAIAKSTDEEDTEKGVDFWFYNKESKKWIGIDFTTSNELKYRGKDRKVDGIDVYALKIGRYDLILAAQGGENYINKVVAALNEIIVRS